MSGYNYQSDLDELDDEARQDTSGKGLRAQLEEVLKLNRELTSRLNQQDKEKSVAELVKDAKLDPAVAALAAQQTDPAAWIEANKALFRPAPEVEDTTDVVVVDNDDPAVELERSAAAAVAAAEADGVPAVTQQEVDRVSAISSEDELLKEIARAAAQHG